MVANHRGLQSLGRVLTLGMTCYLFTAWVMLPCLLTWITATAAIRSSTDRGEGIRDGFDSASARSTTGAARADALQRDFLKRLRLRWDRPDPDSSRSGRACGAMSFAAGLKFSLLLTSFLAEFRRKVPLAAYTRIGR